MKQLFAHVVVLVIAALTAAYTSAAESVPADALYARHCAACHGASRLGGIGPALLPQNLSRLKAGVAAARIRDGRAATQMPAFGALLSEAEIAALVAMVYSPVVPLPQWREADIRSSRIVHHAPGTLPDKPAFEADLMNLFIVVETGDHHVSVLDGDRMERIHRFPSRFALHGGPKFSPDGRYVYFASRDGWISKFDLWNLKVVSEVRAGINTRNAAVSADGRFVAVANTLPGTVVILDDALKLVKVIEASTLAGDPSRVSAVYDAAPRRSFVAALKDVPEIWEISYDENAAPIHDGYVHDYKMRESIELSGYLNPRRTRLTAPMEDFFFSQNYANVMGTARGGRGQVVNLNVRRRIADLDIDGMPHLGSGITWDWQGRRVMGSPNLKDGIITVIDMQDWSTVKRIPTLGPGFFMRSHENSRYAFADSMMSRDGRDTLQVIDKETLEVVAELRPEPGKTLAHVEFDRHGNYAIASLWEREGALIFYDAKTLEEIKRLPASRPVGKYNVYNKISRSEGTSH